MQTIGHSLVADFLQPLLALVDELGDALLLSLDVLDADRLVMTLLRRLVPALLTRLVPAVFHLFLSALLLRHL